jgi:hypothetical protein
VELVEQKYASLALHLLTVVLLAEPPWESWRLPSFDLGGGDCC